MIDFWMFSILDFCTRLIEDRSKGSRIGHGKLRQTLRTRVHAAHPPVGLHQSSRGEVGLWRLWCSEGEWEEWPRPHWWLLGWGLKRAVAHVFTDCRNICKHGFTNPHIQINLRFWGKKTNHKTKESWWLSFRSNKCDVFDDYQSPRCALTCVVGVLGSLVRLQFSICFSISLSFSAVFRANSTSAASCSSPAKNTFTSFLLSCIVTWRENSQVNTHLRGSA